MKHIVYIITKLELGGAQKVCLSLMHELPKQGVSTSLITGAQGVLLEKVCDTPNIFFLKNMRREIGFKNIVKEVRVFIELWSLLKKMKKKYPELIVHTHSTKAGLLGRWAAFFARIPTRVHTIHGFAFHEHQAWFSWLCIYACELITSLITTRFVCVSDKDRLTGLRLFPFFKNKAVIIRASIEDKTFSCCVSVPHKKRDSKKLFIIGTIACFKPQKNLFDLLQAFKMVYHQYDNARLEIIGDGSLRSEIECWIKKNNLAHVITLHGWQNNVAPFLQCWDLFCLSSLWEGLPCAIIEARLCKLPVVAYDTGGISEVILHGKNGFLAPQKNYHVLATHIMQLIEDGNLYQKFADYPDNLVSFYEHTMINAHKQLYSTL